MEQLLAQIEAEGVPAPAPIEQCAPSGSDIQAKGCRICLFLAALSVAMMGITAISLHELQSPPLTL